MEAVIIILFVIFVVFIAIVQAKRHKSRMEEKISSIGGQIIRTERKTFSTGPFLLVGRGRIVYRIEYRLGNEIKEGWVKFGGLFGPDWRL